MFLRESQQEKYNPAKLYIRKTPEKLGLYDIYHAERKMGGFHKIVPKPYTVAAIERTYLFLWGACKQLDITLHPSVFGEDRKRLQKIVDECSINIDDSLN